MTILTLGLTLLLLLRLIERPLCGPRRPVTPWITVAVCRIVLLMLGLRSVVSGSPQTGPGALVANHSSWLDIFVLNAATPMCFVAKAEVAGWPGIGWLARATGTLFIRRDRADVQDQIARFRDMLAAGHRLALFPEGTSTDGRQVLPFRPALFAAFVSDAGAGNMQVQPVSLQYLPPAGADPRHYAWWGDMAFLPHLLAVLGQRGAGRVRVHFHAPLPVSLYSDRKALALAAERAVRSAQNGAQ